MVVSFKSSVPCLAHCTQKRPVKWLNDFHLSFHLLFTAACFDTDQLLVWASPSTTFNLVQLLTMFWLWPGPSPHQAHFTPALYIREGSQVVLVVKNLPANAGDARDLGLIPGSGKSPGEGNGNPFQYSCLENPMDRGAWQATVHRVAELDTTEAI